MGFHSFCSRIVQITTQKALQKYALKFFVILFAILSTTSFTYAVDVNTNPRFMVGAGLGMAKAGQNVDGATGSTSFGLSGTVAYAPIDHWFAGFDIYTFSPASSVRASNYMFSAIYHMKNYSFGLLMGLQTVVDARADGSATDPLTGNVLAKNTNSFSYGLKVSYDKLIDLKRTDFNLGISPVMMIVKCPGQQNFNELLFMLEFRLWAY